MSARLPLQAKTPFVLDPRPLEEATSPARWGPGHLAGLSLAGAAGAHRGQPASCANGSGDLTSRR